MIAKATELGCTNNGDNKAYIRCLCMSKDFSYGIRDCCNQSCPEQSMADDTIKYGIEMCACKLTTKEMATLGVFAVMLTTLDE